MEIDPAFRPLLRAFDLEALEAEGGSVYGLWPDLRLAYTNQAWARFALANDGADVLARWPLGASIRGALSGPPAKVTPQVFGDVLRSQAPWGQIYECSSAERERRLMMQVLPLGSDGLLVTNALVVERPHDPTTHPTSAPDDAVYRRRGVVVQCSYCRRVRAVGPDAGERWDWVPEWVRHPPPETSHSLCETCLGFYYPQYR